MVIDTSTKSNGGSTNVEEDMVALCAFSTVADEKAGAFSSERTISGRFSRFYAAGQAAARQRSH